MAMPNSLVIIFAVSLLATPPADPDGLRTWSDAAGRMRVKAALIDFNGQKVWLRRADNRVFVVPATALSRADREFLDAEVRRRGDAAAKSAPEGFRTIPYGPARRLAYLADERIDESSGLAASGRRPGVFFTHNDSGDDARVYALDLKGHNLGTARLAGIHSYDLEDIATLRIANKPHLLLGDIGNNGLAAGVQVLYLIEEPKVDPERGMAADAVDVKQTIHLSFEDDHRNCEGLAVDPASNTILLVTKERAPRCHVYAMPWPENNPKKVFTARRIATLKIPAATALDVSPDGRRAIVLAYSDAYEYHRGEEEDWAAAFSRSGRLIRMPLRAQGESICYGADGKTLYLTSEQLPTPLWEVPASGP